MSDSSSFLNKIDVSKAKTSLTVNTGRNLISSNSLVKNKPGAFEIKCEEPTVKVEWHRDFSVKSKHLPSYKFTNFIDVFSEPNTEFAISKMNEDLNCIKKRVSSVDITSQNRDRLLGIINNYLDGPSYNFEDDFKKTTLPDMLGAEGSFRVVSLFYKDMKTKEHFLYILFVDPYHLFIPSKHKKKTADEMLADTYAKYNSNLNCISKLIKVETPIQVETTKQGETPIQ